MDPLLDLLRKGTEYGLSPPLLVVLVVVWLAWRFPGLRALLTRSLTGGGPTNGNRFVTRDACHAAQEALGKRFDDAAERIRAEMTAGFTRVHERIDDLLKPR
jgi:hypothetical protein